MNVPNFQSEGEFDQYLLSETMTGRYKSFSRAEAVALYQVVKFLPPDADDRQDGDDSQALIKYQRLKAQGKISLSFDEIKKTLFENDMYSSMLECEPESGGRGRSDRLEITVIEDLRHRFLSFVEWKGGCPSFTALNRLTIDFCRMVYVRRESLLALWTGPRPPFAADNNIQLAFARQQQAPTNVPTNMRPILPGQIPTNIPFTFVPTINSNSGHMFSGPATINTTTNHYHQDSTETSSKLDKIVGMEKELLGGQKENRSGQNEILSVAKGIDSELKSATKKPNMPDMDAVSLEDRFVNMPESPMLVPDTETGDFTEEGWSKVLSLNHKIENAKEVKEKSQFPKVVQMTLSKLRELGGDGDRKGVDGLLAALSANENMVIHVDPTTYVMLYSARKLNTKPCKEAENLYSCMFAAFGYEHSFALTVRKIDVGRRPQCEIMIFSKTIVGASPTLFYTMYVILQSKDVKYVELESACELQGKHPRGLLPFDKEQIKMLKATGNTEIELIFKKFNFEKRQSEWLSSKGATNRTVSYRECVVDTVDLPDREDEISDPHEPDSSDSEDDEDNDDDAMSVDEIPSPPTAAVNIWAQVHPEGKWKCNVCNGYSEPGAQTCVVCAEPKVLVRELRKDAASPAASPANASTNASAGVTDLTGITSSGIVFGANTAAPGTGSTGITSVGVVFGANTAALGTSAPPAANPITTSSRETTTEGAAFDREMQQEKKQARLAEEEKIRKKQEKEERKRERQLQREEKKKKSKERKRSSCKRSRRDDSRDRSIDLKQRLSRKKTRRDDKSRSRSKERKRSSRKRSRRDDSRDRSKDLKRSSRKKSRRDHAYSSISSYSSSAPAAITAPTGIAASGLYVGANTAARGTSAASAANLGTTSSHESTMATPPNAGSSPMPSASTRPKRARKPREMYTPSW